MALVGLAAAEAQKVRQAMAIENVVAKDQRDTIAADEIAPDGEGFRELARLVLCREAEADPACRSRQATP